MTQKALTVLVALILVAPAAAGEGGPINLRDFVAADLTPGKHLQVHRHDAGPFWTHFAGGTRVDITTASELKLSGTIKVADKDCKLMVHLMPSATTNRLDYVAEWLDSTQKATVRYRQDGDTLTLFLKPNQTLKIKKHEEGKKRGVEFLLEGDGPTHKVHVEFIAP